MSHVSHMFEERHTHESGGEWEQRESNHASAWVSSHMWMSHVSHVNEPHIQIESRHIFEWVMSRTNQLESASSDTKGTTIMQSKCGSVLQQCVAACCSVLQRGVLCCSNIKGTTIVQSNYSRHTFELVMSHMWMSHVTHVNDSCHTHESGGEWEQRCKGQHHSAVEARTPKRSSSAAPPQNSTSSPV